MRKNTRKPPVRDDHRTLSLDVSDVEDFCLFHLGYMENASMDSHSIFDNLNAR